MESSKPMYGIFSVAFLFRLLLVVPSSSGPSWLTVVVAGDQPNQPALPYTNDDRLTNNNTTIPSPYPVTFHVQFVTNLSNSATIITTHGDVDDDASIVYGTLYYDWTQRAQRIDHAAGSYECERFYHTDGPCSLLFLTDGMYRILLPSKNNNENNNSKNNRHSDDDDDDNVDCCLDLPNIGAPPPDWASQAPSTFRGWVVDGYSNILSKEWWYDRFFSNDSSSSVGSRYRIWPFHRTTSDDVESETTTATLPFHTTRQVAARQEFPEGFPVLFTFPGKAEGRQDMHYLLRTLKQYLPQGHSSLFDLPPGCRHRLCSNTTGPLEEKTIRFG